MNFIKWINSVPPPGRTDGRLPVDPEKLTSDRTTGDSPPRRKDHQLLPFGTWDGTWDAAAYRSPDRTPRQEAQKAQTVRGLVLQPGAGPDRSTNGVQRRSPGFDPHLESIDRIDVLNRTYIQTFTWREDPADLRERVTRNIEQTGFDQ